MIVVDTNILVYFYLPTELSELTDELHQIDPYWVAPKLWKSEFLNAVSLYLRKNLIDYPQALQIVNESSMRMNENQFEVDMRKVLSFVHQSSCSSYDCEFVSLADELGVPLITNDGRILKNFPDIAISPEAYIGSSRTQ